MSMNALTENCVCVFFSRMMASALPRLGNRTIWLFLGCGLVMLVQGCQSPSSSMKQPASERDEPSDESENPDQPRPVLPEAAFFLGEYAALELTINAHRDGTLESVVVSKPSRAKLYDEYTRNWVETHWKMPPAKADDPDLRKFIAPIVYPHKAPPGGKYPPPPYPGMFMEQHIQGLVLVGIDVSSGGKVEEARILISSRNKRLDNYTMDWVKSHWTFPSGLERNYACPISFVFAGSR
jgi:TonB family protein